MNEADQEKPEQEKEIDVLIQMQEGSLKRLHNIETRLRRFRAELFGKDEPVCSEAQDKLNPEFSGPRLMSVTNDIQQQITEIEDLMDSIERYA